MKRSNFLFQPSLILILGILFIPFLVKATNSEDSVDDEMIKNAAGTQGLIKDKVGTIPVVGNLSRPETMDIVNLGGSTDLIGSLKNIKGVDKKMSDVVQFSKNLLKTFSSISEETLVEHIRQRMDKVSGLKGHVNRIPNVHLFIARLLRDDKAIPKTLDLLVNHEIGRASCRERVYVLV